MASSVKSCCCGDCWMLDDSDCDSVTGLDEDVVQLDLVVLNQLESKYMLI